MTLETSWQTTVDMWCILWRSVRILPLHAIVWVGLLKTRGNVQEGKGSPEDSQLATRSSIVYPIHWSPTGKWDAGPVQTREHIPVAELKLLAKLSPVFSYTLLKHYYFLIANWYTLHLLGFHLFESIIYLLLLSDNTNFSVIWDDNIPNASKMCLHFLTREHCLIWRHLSSMDRMASEWSINT